MKDTIRTLHPEKKQGVKIIREKYGIIRDAILSTLSAQHEITFRNLSRAVEKEVNGNFEGWLFSCTFMRSMTVSWFLYALPFTSFSTCGLDLGTRLITPHASRSQDG